MTTADTRPAAENFQQDVLDVVHRVRTAFTAVINVLPGPPRHARQLARVLGIDATLGWKVFKAAHGSDPLLAAQHIPTRAALAGFRKAAARRGVSAELLDSVDAAVAEFERLIDIHAGDRASFETMLNGYASEGGEIQLSVRRAAFKANSSIWGVQAEAQLSATFLAPGTQPGMLDVVGLRGFVQLKRLRPDVSWVVGRVRAATDRGQARPGVVWEPLDAGIDPTEAPLLKAFCSQPLPELRSVTSISGVIEHELVEGPVGNTAAITCFTAQVARNAVSCVRSEDNRYGEVGAAARTPAAVLVLDLIVHEQIYGRIQPELKVYSELHERPAYPAGGRERTLLPIREEVTYLGKGPAVVHTPAIPRYTDMAAYVFDRMGWDGNRFDVYRVQIRFPVIPAMVVLSHEL